MINVIELLSFYKWIKTQVFNCNFFFVFYILNEKKIILPKLDWIQNSSKPVSYPSPEIAIYNRDLNK